MKLEKIEEVVQRGLHMNTHGNVQENHFRSLLIECCLRIYLKNFGSGSPYLDSIVEAWGIGL